MAFSSYIAKNKYPFTTAYELDDMIDQYFNDIEEKNVPDEGQIKNTEKEIAPGQKLPKSKSQQITITGLALHLGFSRRAGI